MQPQQVQQAQQVQQSAALTAQREQWKLDQKRLRSLVVKTDVLRYSISAEHMKYSGNRTMLKYVGGLDISFVKGTDRAVACLSILEYPSLREIETFYHPCLMTDPYMPGFLGFREVPHLKVVVNMFLEKYKDARDNMVLLVDGNGLLHYRGLGAACHLGVLMDIPTIGVAKELLVIDGMVKEDILYWCSESLYDMGDYIYLEGPNSGRVHGAAMLTTNVEEPIYISIGHRVCLNTAIEIVQRCLGGEYLPEPTRLADGLSRDYIARNPNFTVKTVPKPAPTKAPFKKSHATVYNNNNNNNNNNKKLATTSTTEDNLKLRERERFSNKFALLEDEGAGTFDRRRFSPKKLQQRQQQRQQQNETCEDDGEEDDTTESNKRKRDVWGCSCGATVELSDFCPFCYHSRPSSSWSESASKVPTRKPTQEIRTNWSCSCGEQNEARSEFCPGCYHVRNFREYLR